MGVINRNEVQYKNPDEVSSTESLHIPVSSSTSLSSIASIPIPPTRRQRHHRTLADSPISSPRNVGRRRQRRIKAVAELSSLIEEDEPEEYMEEGIPHNSLFSKITNNPDLEYILEQSSADDDSKLAKLLGKYQTAVERKRKLTTASYSNISHHVKLAFKMMRSLYELDKMETEIIEFFTNTPNNEYISSNKSCFQRLLIHGIAQYYSLKATSFNTENGIRSIQVKNPHKYCTFNDIRLYFIVQKNHNKRV